jgi:quinoprotein glucose dehydrogenase
MTRKSAAIAAFSTLMALSACDNYQDPPPIEGQASTRAATPYFNHGGEGGLQYANGDQITAENIARLKPLWSYHTGDVSSGGGEVASATAFELSPILAEGALYVCSPFNRVIALDPLSAKELWNFDPKIDLQARYANRLVCRGVSFWRDEAAQEDALCAATIFTATNDARLIALDAKSGALCLGFGVDGAVDLSKGPGEAKWAGEYQHTSPPTVIDGKVVIGGSVSDGARTDAPSGVVRAYDARSGALAWAQDMAPPGYDYDGAGVSEGGYALGSPNVWAPMVADGNLNLVYAPTGNPAPDYFRATEPDIAHYGSSLVALNGDTGEIVWHYQFVHRDFWDFDTPAQPTLFELERDGQKIPAVAQATKMGFIFILDRRTGEPLFPVEERPVPQNTNAEGLVLSATQPFPVLPKPVTETDLDPQDATGLTFWDAGWCQDELESLHFEGMYTPVSTDWTLMYPGNAGGPNWGGLSIDPERQLLVVNASNLAFKVKLIPRDEFEAVKKANPGREVSPQSGTAYGMWREAVLSPIGLPCNPSPWATLTGIDLKTGEHIWQSTLGTVRDLAPIPLELGLGTPTLGGPLTTKGGLTFIGATLDNYLRAFDNMTGEEIWRGRLPAPAVSTPMSYLVQNGDGAQQQIILVAAGGAGHAAGALSDTIVAFGLAD